MKYDFETIIVGGGPAGLSAALALARMSRRTLVVDDARPRNAPSAHLNNFITRDGIHPAEWRRIAREDLSKYPTVEFRAATVTAAAKTDRGFRVSLSSGEELTAGKLILADGVRDILPAVAGFRELWGKAVFHCPYCHGYEVRNERLGYIANPSMLMHKLPMIYGLSKDLVVFTNGRKGFSLEDRRALEAREIELIEEKITALVHDGDRLKAVELSNGDVRVRDGLFLDPDLPIPLKSDLGEKLGCARTEAGFYKVNERGETTVPGVFAAGDNIAFSTVLFSAASGGLAGGGAAAQLLTEEFTEWTLA